MTDPTEQIAIANEALAKHARVLTHPSGAQIVFPGGAVSIPKPTRADLIRSIGEWAYTVKDHADKIYGESLIGSGEFDARRLVALKSAVGLLENAIRELGGAK